MDYVTMSDIHFSYDLLKIDGEDVEQYLNNMLSDISKTNDLDFIGQEEETMKGGSVMYEKFRDMVDYVKSTAIESITGRTKTLNDLLAPVNKPEEGPKKQEEEVVPLEEKMKEEHPMETPTEEVQKQEEQEPEPKPEESDPEKKEERDEIRQTDEEYDDNIEPTKKEEEEEEKSTKEEVEENEDDELSNVSDDEDGDIIEKEITFKPKSQDALMEILELKMIKLLLQKEN
jgi:hypothetical protein